MGGNPADKGRQAGQVSEDSEAKRAHHVWGHQRN